MGETPKAELNAEKEKKTQYWHEMKAADEKKVTDEKKKREEYWHEMKAAEAAEKNAAEENTAAEEALTVAEEKNGVDDEERAVEETNAANEKNATEEDVSHTAPLSEEGDQALAVHKDDEAMLKSVRRQLDIEPTADEKKAAEEKKRREEYWHKMKAANAAEKNAAGDNKAVE